VTTPGFVPGVITRAIAETYYKFDSLVVVLIFCSVMDEWIEM